MNKQHREKISALISEVKSLQGRINALQTEEQDYFDNMPEGIQAGKKGERAEEAANNLENATIALDDCLDYLTNAKE